MIKLPVPLVGDGMLVPCIDGTASLRRFGCCRLHWCSRTVLSEWRSSCPLTRVFTGAPATSLSSLPMRTRAHVERPFPLQDGMAATISRSCAGTRQRLSTISLTDFTCARRHRRDHCRRAPREPPALV